MLPHIRRIQSSGMAMQRQIVRRIHTHTALLAPGSTSAPATAAPSSPLPSLLSDRSLFRQDCYINGRWVAGSGAHPRIDVRSPTSGALIGSIPSLSRADTSEAIESAEAAQRQWASKSASERAKVLAEWHRLCMQHQKDLATILNMEQGKPVPEAAGEIAYGAGFFHVYAGEAERIHGEVLQPANPNTRVLTYRQPVGVVGAITPWNFPNAMITRKCGAALAAGCTVVLKPSEFTPFSAFALAELGERAGLPAGCFNLVTGNASEIGTELTENPKVKKITFTGSTRVGKILLKQCAGTVKRTSMELGGNAPYIVFDDADVDAAIKGLMHCKFRNSGQTCVTANRIFVQSGIYDTFAKKLAERVKTDLKQGCGREEGVNVGPLINAAAVAKVADHVADAVSKGGKILVGGKSGVTDGLVGKTDASLFFQPTVITGATSTMEVAQEETFGPIAFLFKFDTESEVLDRANDVNAGLAAYFWTRDPARIWRVSEGLHYGMVGANSASVSSTTAPFGGVKESGFGREGSHHGLTDYLDIKAVHVGL